MSTNKIIIIVLCIALFFLFASGFISCLAIMANSGNETETKQEKIATPGATEKKIKATKKVEELIIVTSQKLSKDYEENELRADKKYKNKKAEITGQVEGIGEVLGNTYILMGSDDLLYSVYCTFNENEKEIEGYGITVDVKNCTIK